MKRTYDPYDGPHPVDIYVGSRLRQQRRLLGLTQQNLAKALGLTFQQIQKYERGNNRMGASRLFEMSKLLNVGINFFYDGYENNEATYLGFAEEMEEEGTPVTMDALTRRETIELVKCYYSIKNPKLRERVLELAKTLSEESN